MQSCSRLFLDYVIKHRNSNAGVPIWLGCRVYNYATLAVPLTTFRLDENLKRSLAASVLRGDRSEIDLFR